MGISQSVGLALGTLFNGFYEDVDPDNDDDGLTEQRLEQWRPLWQNPFANPDIGLSSSGSDYSQFLAANAGDNVEKAKTQRTATSNAVPSQESLVPKLVQTLVTHAGPTWVNLFYDLAWTATFSTLTQNGNFNDAWDTVSYTAFFLVVWWLWASQTLYSIHFYTNDWFHLLSLFLQLVIFGLLAATTRAGYDVTAYILKSPGADRLDPQTVNQMFDPDRYQKDRIASYSMRVIAFALAASRAIHWFQHIFVLNYARRTAKELKLSVPLKLRVLPVGLAVSNSMFWAAAVVTLSSRGKTVSGAKLKFILWAAGLVSEVLLHGVMEHLKWQDISFGPLKWSNSSKDTSHEYVPAQPKLHELQPVSSNGQSSQSTSARKKRIWPIPRSNVQLRERLEGITTVILGEGINGIAGTFYAAVIAAAELGEQVYTNLASAAIIVYLLAYLYFEGPTANRNPKGSGLRQMMWLLLHLPFMLSIMLLLLGVKNQFLLTSYLSTATETFDKFDTKLWQEEIDPTDSNSAENSSIKWFLLKRGLKWADEFNELRARLTHNGSAPLDAPEEDSDVITIWYMQLYLKIMLKVYEDMHLPYDAAPSSYHSEQVTTGSSVLGARYIAGLAAIILISLGIMNRIHSKPRVVGSSTLAAAFMIEFFIELALHRLAGLAIARKRGRLNGPLRRAFFRPLKRPK
ncbi:Bacterial low temperature requirement A protein (LtrA) [Rhizoctonia solani]|uniref:Bacterial low temperature requirement A protein (LtrA) n=1 Tax=Rhizoctonia solani TaxID=456999 RepID=A0A8H7I5Z4_9AGAM|nr:Bacterial low temperature requirement A protein (LtrA) [Rhizoctonia solani]